MEFPASTRVVVITGSVWTGSRRAPRKLLVKDGFVRPLWFTTGLRVTDADYRQISSTRFHQQLAAGEVLAHLHYGGDDMGILEADFLEAARESSRGVLVVAPPEIAAQLAARIPHALLFTLKGEGMERSRHLENAHRAGQLVRVEVDTTEAGAWERVHTEMLERLGLLAE